MKNSFITFFKVVFISLFSFLFAGGKLVALYVVPEGKSIFLKSPVLNDINWTSTDDSIATVSEDGVALALKSGLTKINAIKNNEIISSYEIKVVKPEFIKYIYTEPNNVYKNSYVTFFSITSNNVSKVKFIIKFNDEYNEFISTDKKLDGNNFIYCSDFKVPNCNEFLLEINYYDNEVWHDSLINKKITVSKDSSCTDTTLNYKKISTDGINFIKSYEGFKSEFGKDSIAKNETFDIGYGHVIKFGETFYNKITQNEAHAKLLDKINNSTYTKEINEFLISNNIKFNQHQFDALVSFTYNLGTSWIKNSNLKDIILECKDKSLNEIDKQNFTEKLLKYHHCGKICYKGLLYRRIDELEIFFFNDYKRDGNLNKNKFTIPECIINSYGKFI